MLNYDEFSKQTRSRKTILAEIKSIGLAKLFNSIGGGVYARSVDYFVYKVIVDGSELSESSLLNPGQFYYNPETNLLSVRLSDDSDPGTHQVLIGYKFFFSNIGANIPHDLASGSEVHWDARIKDTGELKLEIDFEQTGIAIESDSNISLENNDGYFDDIYDSLIFENQEVKIWSWSEYLPASEAKLIYRGRIKDKAFSSKEVKFNLRDQIKELRQRLVWPTFSSLDGDISESIAGKSKRLVFGKAQHLKTEGIDKVLDGYILTGTLSGSADTNLMTGTVSGLATTNLVNGTGTLFLSEINNGDRFKVIGPFNEYTFTVSNVISDTQIQITGTIPTSFNLFEIRNLEILNNVVTGVGTSFVDEVIPGDTLKVEVDQVQYELTVDTVIDNFNLTLSDEIQRSFTNSVVINNPAIPWRGKNREWHIAGHKLREFSTTITAIIDQVNIEVASIGDIEQDDLITIDGEARIADVVSGNKIRLNQNLPSVTLVGDAVVKIPVSSVYKENQKFIVNRDYTISNTTEAKIVFNDLAEFNVARTESPVIQFQFTNGSNIVPSVASTIDLTTVFQPRDWIRSKDITLPTWYEIKAVSQTQLELINPWAEPTISSLSYKKSPDYIEDDSLITCDCFGLESDGDWIRNASQSVQWLIEQTGLTNINQPSFDNASGNCPFTMSLIYPESLGGDMPEIKEMVSAINGSVFGSLFLDNDFNFKYEILNADHPEDLEELTDSDIIGFSVNTRNNVVSKVQANYRPFTDPGTGEDSFLRYDAESDFTQNTSQNFETAEKTIYLFNQADAEVIAQRALFFRSLSQTIVNVDAKLNLVNKGLNDRMFLNLTRLFKRFGGGDKKKIGIINSINKDGLSTRVSFNDLGNIFNRVGVIAPDTQSDYPLATESEIALWGWVVDNDLEVPDISSEKELGNNLIG